MKRRRRSIHCSTVQMPSAPVLDDLVEDDSFWQSIPLPPPRPPASPEAQEQSQPSSSSSASSSSSGSCSSSPLPHPSERRYSQFKVEVQQISADTAALSWSPPDRRVKEILLQLVPDTSYSPSSSSVSLTPPFIPSFLSSLLFLLFSPTNTTDSDLKVWTFPLRLHHAVCARIRSLAAEGTKVTIIGIPDKVLAALSISSGDDEKSEMETGVCYDDLDGIPDPLRGALFPFQRRGVEFAVSKQGRVLIADEMGLGKTLSASRLVSLCNSRAK